MWHPCVRRVCTAASRRGDKSISTTLTPNVNERSVLVFDNSIGKCNEASHRVFLSLSGSIHEFLMDNYSFPLCLQFGVSSARQYSCCCLPSATLICSITACAKVRLLCVWFCYCHLCCSIDCKCATAKDLPNYLPPVWRKPSLAAHTYVIVIEDVVNHAGDKDRVLDKLIWSSAGSKQVLLIGLECAPNAPQASTRIM